MRDRFPSVGQLTGAVTEFFFPPTCANCKKVGALLCADCFNAIERVSGAVCQRCGRTQPRPSRDCAHCRQQSNPVYVRTAAIYRDPLTKLIHQFKYNQQFALSKPLSRLLAQQWPAWPSPIDALVPVPLHRSRERERGFNQSKRLAEGLGRAVGIPVRASWLKRTRATSRQVGLSAETRRTNVQGAFAAHPSKLVGKHICLIDDVYTTGATMAASAETLRQAGAAQVFGYCLARAVMS